MTTSRKGLFSVMLKSLSQVKNPWLLTQRG